jgi:hypothetical protein
MNEINTWLTCLPTDLLGNQFRDSQRIRICSPGSTRKDLFKYVENDMFRGQNSVNL